MIKIVLYEWLIVFIIKLMPVYTHHSRKEDTISKDWYKVIDS